MLGEKVFANELFATQLTTENDFLAFFVFWHNVVCLVYVAYQSLFIVSFELTAITGEFVLPPVLGPDVLFEWTVTGEAIVFAIS